MKNVPSIYVVPADDPEIISEFRRRRRIAAILNASEATIGVYADLAFGTLRDIPWPALGRHAPGAEAHR